MSTSYEPKGLHRSVADAKREVVSRLVGELLKLRRVEWYREGMDDDATGAYVRFDELVAVLKQFEETL